METVFISCGSRLDDRTTGRMIAEVADRSSARTQVVVVSLDSMTDVRWAALCRLAHAIRAWRTDRCGVVIETSRPAQRSLLAAVGALAPA